VSRDKPSQFLLCSVQKAEKLVVGEVRSVVLVNNVSNLKDKVVNKAGH
jgi:hypothetical protein